MIQENIDAVGAGQRLLIIEDDFLVALDLSQMLQELGYEVVGPVSDVAEALPLVRPAWIDGALVNFDLGGQKATEIADALMEQRLPFIIASGYDPAALPVRYAGVPRLVKPYLADDLRLACARVFGC